METRWLEVGYLSVLACVLLQTPCSHGGAAKEVSNGGLFGLAQNSRYLEAILVHDLDLGTMKFCCWP